MYKWHQVFCIIKIIWGLVLPQPVMRTLFSVTLILCVGSSFLLRHPGVYSDVDISSGCVLLEGWNVASMPHTTLLSTVLTTQHQSCHLGALVAQAICFVPAGSPLKAVAWVPGAILGPSCWTLRLWRLAEAVYWVWRSPSFSVLKYFPGGVSLQNLPPNVRAL